MATPRERLNKYWLNWRPSSKSPTRSVFEKNILINGEFWVEFGYILLDGRVIDFRYSFRNPNNERLVLKFSELKEIGSIRFGRPYNLKHLYVRKFKFRDSNLVRIETNRGYGLKKSITLPLLVYLEMYLKSKVLERDYAFLKRRLYITK